MPPTSLLWTIQRQYFYCFSRCYNILGAIITQPYIICICDTECPGIGLSVRPGNHVSLMRNCHDFEVSLVNYSDSNSDGSLVPTLERKGRLLG